MRINYILQPSQRLTAVTLENCSTLTCSSRVDAAFIKVQIMTCQFRQVCARLAYLS